MSGGTDRRQGVRKDEDSAAAPALPGSDRDARPSGGSAEHQPSRPPQPGKLRLFFALAFAVTLAWRLGDAVLPASIPPLLVAVIALGAPLEVENQWGGTVLNSTLHFALYIPYPDVDYAPVVERLVTAGADASVVDPFPTGHAAIDAVLRLKRG